MARIVDFSNLRERVIASSTPVCRGRVTGAAEQVIEAELPGARVGLRVAVERRDHPDLPAQVAACEGIRVVLLPLASTSGVGPGDQVTTLTEDETVPTGRSLLGRIIDPLGRPVDGGGGLPGSGRWPLECRAPDPLTRRPVDQQLVTGLRAIDGCLSLGLGQRIGLFAGPGIGKSSLLGILARRARCDVSIVCLVGERGREVRDFLDRVLDADARERTVVVLAQADAPPLVRARALVTATAVAESFRAEGQHALLLVDSLTRVVRARRDVALALGEAPARSGFPSSAFAALPSLLERTGRDATGSITAVYAVLTEGDSSDPVAEEARSLLDGHIRLSARLADKGHWPAIDITRSVSRVMDGLVAGEHRRDAARLKRLVAAREQQADLILMGAYRAGSSPDTDLAIERWNGIKRFLRQGVHDFSSLEATTGALRDLARGMDTD
jgi:FliI/YscN family ATPase